MKGRPPGNKTPMDASGPGGAAVGGLGLLLMAGLLYVVPRWALLAWLWRGDGLSWAEVGYVW